MLWSFSLLPSSPCIYSHSYLGCYSLVSFPSPGQYRAFLYPNLMLQGTCASVLLDHLQCYFQILVLFFPRYGSVHGFCSEKQSYWLELVSEGSLMAQLVKNLSPKAEDLRDKDSIPGMGRSPRGGHGNPLQYSCLENPTDRGAWRATVHVTAKGACTH